MEIPMPSAPGTTTEQDPPPPYGLPCDSSVLSPAWRMNTEITYHDPTIPHPVFPAERNRLHPVTNRHAPNFADHQPVGFNREVWDVVWEGREYRIDKHLRQAHCQNGDRSLWTYEREFQGAPYRLSIDHKALNGLPVFKTGMIISFERCNDLGYQYLIDHCVLKDDSYAYLKVVCFDRFQEHYDANSYRPPLILLVPQSHCDVRTHPNLEFKGTTPITLKPAQRSLWQRPCRWNC